MSLSIPPPLPYLISEETIGKLVNIIAGKLLVSVGSCMCALCKKEFNSEHAGLAHILTDCPETPLKCESCDFYGPRVGYQQHYK